MSMTPTRRTRTTATSSRPGAIRTPPPEVWRASPAAKRGRLSLLGVALSGRENGLLFAKQPSVFADDGLRVDPLLDREI